MRYFLSFIFMTMLCVPVFAGTGSHDDREYVNWSESPYNQIVYLSDFGCTAQYVDKNLLLTARHCIQHNEFFDKYENLNKLYEFVNSDYKISYAKLKEYGRYNFDKDWALLQVLDPAFYSDKYFDVSPSAENIVIQRAGFGFMRLISDEEINKLRDIFAKAVEKADFKNDREKKAYSYNLNILARDTQEQVSKTGMKPLSEMDYHTVYVNGQSEARAMPLLKAQKECKLFNAGKNRIKVLMDNFVKDNLYAGYVSSTCDSMQGDSGGAYFANNVIHAVESRGTSSFNDDENTDSVVDTRFFYQPLLKLKKQISKLQQDEQDTEKLIKLYEKQEDVKMGSVQNATNNDTNDSSEYSATYSLTQIGDMDKWLENRLSKIKDMSDDEFLIFLQRFTERQVLQKQYEEAKAREQSLPNKINTAVAIASEGIGGMLLAKGLAEKKADESAERDMKAYLQTFKCDYGQGPNIRGGTENVELPGANTLLPLYQEYKELAADLKMRKEALGLKPGIESEVILDKSNMGLYDDVNLGIEGGAYTSISRALRDPNGKDAEEWEKQKKQSQTEAIAGGSVAGAGAISTTVGNIVINKDAQTIQSKSDVESMIKGLDLDKLKSMAGYNK